MMMMSTKMIPTIAGCAVLLFFSAWNMLLEQQSVHVSPEVVELRHDLQMIEEIMDEQQDYTKKFIDVEDAKIAQQAIEKELETILQGGQQLEQEEVTDEDEREQEEYSQSTTTQTEEKRSVTRADQSSTTTQAAAETQPAAPAPAPAPLVKSQAKKKKKKKKTKTKKQKQPRTPSKPKAIKSTTNEAAQSAKATVPAPPPPALPAKPEAPAQPANTETPRTSAPAPAPATNPPRTEQTRAQPAAKKGISSSPPPPPAVPATSEPASTPSAVVVSSSKRQQPPLARMHIHTIAENQRSMNDEECYGANVTHPCMAETIYKYGSFSIPNIVNKRNSPGKPLGGNWPARNQTYAICQLTEMGSKKAHWLLLDDTPHHLQELYRCFSWWSLNPHQKPMLVSPNSKPPKQHYMKSYYDALEQVHGVEIKYNSEKPKGQMHISVLAPIAHFNVMLNAYALNKEAVDRFIPPLVEHLAPPPPSDDADAKNDNSRQRAGCAKGKTKPIIWMLNREGSRRILENYKAVLAALQQSFSDYEIHYQASFSNTTFQEQVQFMSKADILISPHGQQEMSVVFLPKCGALMELFNEHYYMPNFFGSLSAASGHGHYFLYNGGGSGRHSMGRARTRQYFQVSPQHVVYLTQRAIQRWNTCCQYGFRNRQGQQGGQQQ